MEKDENYTNEEGFSYSATLDEIREHDYVLTPGRYVGIEEEEDDGIPFEEKLIKFKRTIELFEESKNLRKDKRKSKSKVIIMMKC